MFVLLWVIHKGPSTLSSKLSIDESWDESEKLEDVLFRGRGEQRTRPSVCAIKKNENAAIPIEMANCDATCAIVRGSGA